MAEKQKRYDWLVQVVNFNLYRVGAEVGVASGITSRLLLKFCPSLQRLYAVDIWKPMPGSGWEGLNLKEEFIKNTQRYAPRLTLFEGLSWEMASKVKDGILDFVFIDADHDYDSVKKDIKAWLPKVRQGGMISGHDVNLEGVKRAVNEAFPKFELVGSDNVWYAMKI